MTWKKSILNTVERSRTEYDMEKINTAHTRIADEHFSVRINA